MLSAAIVSARDYLRAQLEQEYETFFGVPGGRFLDDVADAWPETPILGFTNHTDTHGLQRAHAAGFDQVIVKSALVERARQVVDELVGVDA